MNYVKFFLFSFFTFIDDANQLFSDDDMKVELPLLSPGAEAEFSEQYEAKIKNEEKQELEDENDTWPSR